jgi:hypothetical protein
VNLRPDEDGARKIMLRLGRQMFPTGRERSRRVPQPQRSLRLGYDLYDALWPLETNLLAMLPKPDREARAIYTGVLHPSVISECALGLSLYFDELLIEHPFIHPRTVNKQFSPLEHPSTYRQEFLKSVVLFMAIMPLVEQGLVTLFPDPCNFDFHLRDQMRKMAKFRSRGIKVDPKEEAGFMEMMKEDHRCGSPLQRIFVA